MKKLSLGLAALLWAGSAWAGSIDYLSNQSAEYIRTFSRNASLDADAAVYNPAGTAFLPQGLTFNLSNQSILKEYSSDFDIGVARYDGTYQSTEPTLVLPNTQIVYNGGGWAGFLALGVTGGGGTVDYTDGVPYMAIATTSVVTAAATATGGYIDGGYWASGSLKATSIYPQATAGGAYALGTDLSVSAGIRAVYGYKTFSGSADYTFLHGGAPISAGAHSGGVPYGTTLEADVSQTALGFGGIFGANWKALPGLLVSTRIETATPLDFETQVNDDADFGGLFTDGETQRRDLPALVALGVRYDAEALSITASGTGYLLGLSRSSAYAEDYADFGWDAGASVEYAVLPWLKASAGGLVTRVGGNEDTYNDFDFSLDSQTLGAGLVLVPLADLQVNLAASHTFYNSSSGQADTTTYGKAATTLAVSCSYKLF